MQRYISLFLSMIFLITALIPVQAKRIALLIGNSNYRVGGALSNPVNDVNDMKKVLTNLGFKVILKRNANRRTMINAVQKFGRSLNRGDVALFFYAGHGLQFQNRNFLVPIGANIKSEADIEFEAVDANRVLKQITANNGINIVILDACRNNPFSQRLSSSGRSFSVGRGLARMNSPTGTLIAYATSPGDLAEDGNGRNGTFTKHLLSALRNKPYLSITELFTEVTGKVVKETKRKQVPWQSASLTQRFCFGKCLQYKPQQSVPNVSRLLRTCARHLKANRLTSGRGGTALACYEEVLKKDSNNANALAGLDKIAARYVTWAERALKRGQKRKAKRYLASLRQVNPESPELARLEEQLLPSPSPSTPPPRYTRIGKNRALLIGIDEYKYVPQLTSCKKDVTAMKRLIQKVWGFKNREIKVLVDSKATKKSILRAIDNWLIRATEPGDRVFFFYSGHGVHVEDKSGDEDDSRDEAIVPVDTNKNLNNLIIDDELAARFKRLKGRKVMMIFDAPHSGTMTDGIARIKPNMFTYSGTTDSGVAMDDSRGGGLFTNT